MLALELAKRGNISPANIAAITATVGAAGTLLAPSGAAQTLAASVLGLGACLFAVDRMQPPAARPAAPTPAALPPAAAARPALAQRQADDTYVTRDELQEALRRVMFEHSAQMADHVEGAVRRVTGGLPAPQPGQSQQWAAGERPRAPGEAGERQPAPSWAGPAGAPPWAAGERPRAPGEAGERRPAPNAAEASWAAGERPRSPGGELGDPASSWPVPPWEERRDAGHVMAEARADRAPWEEA
jgi:hypothetical protein